MTDTLNQISLISLFLQFVNKKKTEWKLQAYAQIISYVRINYYLIIEIIRI